jgi:hypothetical protein
LEASVNYVCFKTGPGLVPFSNLVLYSFYLYLPPAYNACINNLRQIDGAKQQWAIERRKNGDDKVTWEDIMPYMKERPWYPHGGLYSLGNVTNNPTCSIKEHALP